MVGLQRRQHQKWGKKSGVRPICGDVRLPGESDAGAPQGVLKSLKPGFHARRVDVCRRLGSPSSCRRGGGARLPLVDLLHHRGTQFPRSVRLPGGQLQAVPLEVIAAMERDRKFLSRSIATPLRRGSVGFRSGVGSVARLACCKRYRDLDAESLFRFPWVRTPFVPSLRATPTFFLGVLVPQLTHCPSCRSVQWRPVPLRDRSSTLS